MKPQDARGAVAVELAMLVPALLLVAGLIVAGGRLWFARAATAEAATAAARSGSLARSAAEARDSGRETGLRALSTGGLRCRNPTVTVDTAAFGVAVGTPATVTTVVSCDVPLSDVGLPLPGAMHLSARGAAALDTYRSR